MKPTWILFRNDLATGREYRFVDPLNMTTNILIYADNCGEGSYKVHQVMDEIGLKWKHITDFSPKTVKHYQETMLKRLHRVRDMDDDWAMTFESINAKRYEYPLVLRGCDLDMRTEQVIDLRTKIA